MKGMDPAARAGIAIVAVGAVIGSVVLVLTERFRPELQAWVAQDPRARIRIVIIVLTVLTAGPVMAIGKYLWAFGRRARSERPDDARGGWIQAYAAVVGAAGLLLAWFLLRLLP